MDEKQDNVVLKYTVHKFSSYSANYIPENIMVNNPVDQLSRWFTDSSTQSQFIVLKLESPSIVETIKFGKFVKAHVSNLKKFQVLGGTDETNLSLLLSAGLKNDCTAEVFRLRHKTLEGLYLPITYLKIVPSQSWGPAYNYTIWHVELRGKNEERFITNTLETINLRKEEEAVRLLLKHLRRRRYKDAFEALSRESGVKLEGDIQSRLWNSLVENGDFKMAEEIFQEAADEGELEWYLSWQPYSPSWRQMSPCSASVEARLGAGGDAPAPPLDLHSADRDLRPQTESASSPEASEEAAEACGSAACCGKPGPRGGHQLVVDPTTGTLYLFGGWNGTEDLDDLWAYSTREEQWRLLCRHSQLVGGPSPRSCHKVVLDPAQRRLYTLGRYLDNAQRQPSNMKGDLYSYDIDNNSWKLLCDDTESAGGPRLVFDHQMCIDADTQTIYVFGGRVLPANSSESAAPQYSGLYAYYTRTGAWQALLGDRHALAAPQPRVSHSMLFHPVARRLYIFAGQRNKEHLLDLWWWDVGSGQCGALCQGCAAPPHAGFTQRATLDPDTDEMYVLSGMSKEKDRGVYNTLWVFSLRRLTWACVYRNESASPLEPRPRFAHQLVYDHVTKIHYLFGGNPGLANSPRLRLDDLWSLRLERPAVAAVVRSGRAAIREAAYRALCADPARQLAALGYLRTELHELTDHADPLQVSRFQKLATVLFSRGAGAGAGAACPALTPQRARALARRRAGAAATVDLAHAVSVVLGSEETLEPSQPFEEVSEPEPDTWEVGRDEDNEAPGDEWRARQTRMELYDELARYFRPSTVQPPGDIMNLVTL